MALFRSILYVALLALAAGCRRGEEAAPAGSHATDRVEDATAAAPRDVDRFVLRYDTGDRAIWPDYDLPIEHRFNPPEVPESIRGPFPLDTIPRDDSKAGRF